MEIKHKKGFYEKYIKAPQDFLLALLALAVLSPALLAVAVLVRVKLGSPVLFRQERAGLGGRGFKLCKFRTMSDARDSEGKLLPDGERLGEFGRALRSLSIDELPALINVLRFELSLVGPRPLLARYLPRYNGRQARRHEVRPGFTGLAQVNGRNAVSWEDRFDYDVQYVDHVTFLGDWKIMFQTVGKVLKREGVSSGTCATMEEFMGTGREEAG